MRPDQLEKLRQLSERMADRFILDADPANWTGSGLLTRDMTQQERGDAYWCRKAAMATGGVLRYTLDLIKQQDGGALFGTPDDEAAREADLDRKITDAEKRAAQALARVMDKAKGKAEFDRRTQGKG